MVDWEKRVLNDNAILTYKPLAVYDTPTDEDLEKCRELGKSLA